MIIIHLFRERHMKRTMKSSTKKIKIQSATKGLSAQAGMIPVVHFLKKHQLYKRLNQTLGLKRADNAKWQLSDAVYLSTTAIVAGARTLSSVNSLGRFRSSRNRWMGINSRRYYTFKGVQAMH